MRRLGYAIWTAAGVYIILSLVWDEFSVMLGYLLPAVSSAADAGYWWVQIPALAFLGGIISFGVVMSGYNLLSRILD